MAPTASFRKGDALLCGVVVYCGGGGGSSCCNHLNSSNLANRIGPSNRGSNPKLLHDVDGEDDIIPPCTVID